MRATLKNRLKAMDAVYRFCLDNPSIVSSPPALNLSVSGLGVNVQSIRATEALQESNKKGVTISKQEMKLSLVDIASGVAKAGQAYAVSVGNTTLFHELNYPAGTLVSGNSTSTLAKSIEMHDLVAAIPLAERTPFGLSDAVVTSLQDAITEFEEHVSSTTIVKANRHKYTVKLKQLVKEGLSVMRNEVLKLAAVYKTSEPEFYNGLISASRIIDPSTHTKFRFELFDDVTERALAGVKITVDGGVAGSVVTNSKGLGLVYVTEGDHKVKFELENYITMNADYKAKRGSNTLKVQMAPEFVIPAVTTARTNTPDGGERVLVDK